MHSFFDIRTYATSMVIFSPHARCRDSDLTGNARLIPRLRGRADTDLLSAKGAAPLPEIAEVLGRADPQTLMASVSLGLPLGVKLMCRWIHGFAVCVDSSVLS
jgi:hypothetical protein